jgi:mono/diheme cytochrome c family protein
VRIGFALVLAIVAGAAPLLWTPVADALAAASGAALVAELGCGACHADLPEATALRSRLPDLGTAGLRYRSAYLFDYLQDPTRVRRHIGAARMPDFGLSEAEAVALARFLEGERTTPTGALPSLPVEGSPPPPSDAELAALLEEHSCLTCHVLADRGGVTGPPLDGAGARLEQDWMVSFLVAPDHFGVPDGVMPALFLRRDEVQGDWRETAPGARQDLRRIVAGLERTGASRRSDLDAAWVAAQARHPNATVQVGREIFVALNCAGCHPHPGIAPWRDRAPPLAGEGLRVRREWLQGYLAAPEPLRPLGIPAGSGSRMPDFGLDESEVAAVADFLMTRTELAGASLAEPASDGTPLSAFAERKARRLLVEKLPCLGCHRLGEDGGRIGPELASVSRRLQPDFIAAVVRAPREVVPHSSMPLVPMPSDTRELVIRYLQQNEAPAVAVDYPSLVDQRPLAVPPSPPERALYVRYCAACHGADGRGDGPNASHLPVRPTVHADAAALSGRPDDVLFDGIFAGGAILGKSPRMPPWGETLSRSEIRNLVSELRRLCDCAGPAWSARPPEAQATGEPQGTSAAVGARATAPLPASAGRPARPPRFEDFVGAEACAPCHPRAYDAWRTSTHGRAGGRPDEVALIAPFDGKPLVFRDAVVTPRRDTRGRPVFEVAQHGRPPQVLAVAAVVGGGHLAGGGNQTFFAEFPDGTFRFLPFDFSARQGWFVQRRQDFAWVPITPDLPLGAADNWPPHRLLGNDPLGQGCLDCHGSQIERARDAATGEQQTRWVSLSINCESCHGPGRRHIEIMESPAARTAVDIGLAPLELLGKDASIRVCLGCHADKAMLVDGYLPGGEIEDHFGLKLEILRNQTFTPDAKVARFGYQDNHLFSDCYVNGSMVCTDCHDPHTQTYRDIWDRPLRGRFDDGQCTDCHASKASDLASHTHHATGSKGSACVACHMPFLQQKGIGTYVTYERADHTVSIPRPELDAAFGSEGACVRCHADLSIAALQAATDRWWGAPKPRPWYLDAILRAKDAQDLASAAALLLRPEVNHPSAQILALSRFLEDRLAPDMPELDPDVQRRLEGLAASDDLDLAAIALASLHLVRGGDPTARRFLGERIAAQGPHEVSVRMRWRLVLDYLARLYASRGQAPWAAAARAKLAALADGREP